MKRIVKRVALGLVAAIAAVLVAFGVLYASRIQTISNIDQVTSYDDGYNLYTMDVVYDYDLDALLARDIRDNQAFLDAVLDESLPLLPVHMTAPNYACTAFTATAADGEVRMGRNYDFKLDTSALLVRCTPKDGYASIGLAALNNVKAVIEAGGSSMSKVFKVNVFLADMGDFAAVNEVYKEFFSAPYPARSCVAVAALPLGARVEIEAIAVK